MSDAPDVGARDFMTVAVAALLYATSGLNPESAGAGHDARIKSAFARAELFVDEAEKRYPAVFADMDGG